MGNKLFKGALAAMVAVVSTTCLASVTVAHADTQDDQYLASLAAQGIQGDPAQLIAAGHTSCDHYGTAAIAADVFSLMGTFGISNGQAAGLMMAGVRAYCPEKLGGLPVG